MAHQVKRYRNHLASQMQRQKNLTANQGQRHKNLIANQARRHRNNLTNKIVSSESSYQSCAVPFNNIRRILKTIRRSIFSIFLTVAKANVINL
jgi:hypothetical protein